ncbi:hypothetical protein [Mesobacillus harenae]|uniref:hypothetical protein n=1 Tax=Mesobacillus harenae TaxID=2213203 RepID=UPI0015810AF9|nr:hypothetical protein [Mesobacillus harenae]
MFFKSVYVTELFTNIAKEKYIFDVTLGDSKLVKIHVNSSDSKHVTCLYQCLVSEPLFNALRDGFDNETFELSQKEELLEVRNIIRQAYKHFMKTTIYLLDWYEMDVNNVGTLKEYKYSYDGDEWFSIPYILIGEPNATVSVYPSHNITSQTEQIIQKSLNGDFLRSYVALSYLHKAKREQDNRHKWINATIAAELAIKEFLISDKPELRTLIFEVPSPPLHKLYGIVLESFYGEKSPKVSELNKGAFKRNSLIHKPNEVLLTSEEVEKYIKDVEQAIFHLYSLIYKDNTLIKSYLED